MDFPGTVADLAVLLQLNLTIGLIMITAMPFLHSERDIQLLECQLSSHLVS